MGAGGGAEPPSPLTLTTGRGISVPILFGTSHLRQNVYPRATKFDMITRGAVKVKVHLIYRFFVKHHHDTCSPRSAHPHVHLQSE